ncbi:hypothetical protein CVU75_03110 [Candidatus Dependentiae bacterium HGW-Dependentiae-1]|nr:MAG: hypothetical protein CVU75_03110 [Candidatus Dependentiae bacterium HGW-Dependentiae-1]
MKHNTFFSSWLLGALVGVGITLASDSGVQRLTFQQAIGTVFTFDMLQGGFRIPGLSGTFRSTFPVSGVIDLSKGSAPYSPNTLVLERNLVLHDIATVSSLGNIMGAGYTLELPKSVELFPINITPDKCTFSNLTLVSSGNFTWQAPSITFSGSSTISGQGNCITLAPESIITVAAGATLLLQDITIKNLNSANIICASPSSTLLLKNATLELADNVTTWTGNIIVADESVCILKDKQWDFSGDSVLTVSGVTLWKDQAGASSIGNITGTINLINGGIILQQAFGNIRLMQSEIDVLQGFLRRRTIPSPRRR